MRLPSTSDHPLVPDVSDALPLFELTGPSDAPLLVILGGISATRHVTATDADPSPGWWGAVVGQGRAVDTGRWRVLSIEWLDGGQGEDGRPLRLVTTHEQAEAVVRVLDHLGIDRAHAAVGASYGGMVALALAERWPERVGRIVVIGAAHQSDPMSTAIRALQRRIVTFGLELGHGLDAMVLARALAMTTYRTRDEFAARFGTDPVAVEGGSATFEVEQYLVYAAGKFAMRTPPARFLALSVSADLHQVDPAAIRVPAVLVAEEGDTLVPEAQVAELAAGLPGASRLVRLPTIHGHDAFLTDPAATGRILVEALTGEIAAASLTP